MKNIVTVTICIFAFQSGNTQTYLPLLDSNKIWSVLEVNEYSNESRTWQYKMYQDTIINDTAYWLIYSRDDTNVIFTPKEIYLREDTSERKVYYTFTQPSNEELLYDFSLQIGDTLSITDPACSRELVVVNTSTITNSGHVRNQIELASIDSYEQVLWTEGIGSNFGVELSIGQLCISGAGIRLMCVFEDDVISYRALPYCYYNNLGISELKGIDPTIQVIPNPVTSESELVFSSKINQIDELVIFDLYGRKILTKCWADPTTSFKISKHDLNLGIYILRVLYDFNKQISLRFFVI